MGETVWIIVGIMAGVWIFFSFLIFYIRRNRVERGLKRVHKEKYNKSGANVCIINANGDVIIKYSKSKELTKALGDCFHAIGVTNKPHFVAKYTLLMLPESGEIKSSYSNGPTTRFTTSVKYKQYWFESLSLFKYMYRKKIDGKFVWLDSRDSVNEEKQAKVINSYKTVRGDKFDEEFKEWFKLGIHIFSLIERNELPGERSIGIYADLTSSIEDNLKWAQENRGVIKAPIPNDINKYIKEAKKAIQLVSERRSR